MKSKKFIFLAAFMLVASFCSMSSAEIIYLKDGRVLREKIVERKSYYIITKVGRVFNRYYLGQIDRIEEETLVDDMDVDQLEVEGVSIDKAKLIVVFLDICGVRRNMEQNLKRVLDDVPEEQRGFYKKLFNTDEIIERLVPLYDKYYTEKELWDIIEFYESPSGKKNLEVTPEIMKESIGVSLKYFEEKMAP